VWRPRAPLAATFAALVVAGAAHAHADPTIHYLETQNLLASVGLPAAPDVELQLLGLVQEIDRRGYPIKVSVIANETDTGGESAPLANPQQYAEIVVRELELFFEVEAPVILVTPNGFGVSGKHLRGGRLQPFPGGDGRSLLRGIAVPPLEADALARTAMRVVRQVARAGGRPLPAYVPPAKALAPPPGGAAGPAGEGLDTWVWSLVLGSAPLLAWALYALWRRP
jgi:hypothetical protein